MTQAINPIDDAPQPLPSWMSGVKGIRGRIKANVLLSQYTWFQVGGPAEVFFKPADVDDLILFLSQLPRDIPVLMLGVGSNILIRDGGIDGVVIRFGREFATIDVDQDKHQLLCGAAALDASVAQVAFQHRLGGLEFLSGIPGTLGGAVKTNAGAYGGELKNVLVNCRLITRDGQQHMMTAEDLELSYRHSNLTADQYVVQLRLQAKPDDPALIAQRMAEIETKRQESQPVKGKTGGSTFKNPPNHRAWQLIDEAGCRGLQIGGARMSDKHCNFLLNVGGATAEDIEKLGETVRERVFATSGVTLEWEIVRLGKRITSIDNK